MTYKIGSKRKNLDNHGYSKRIKNFTKCKSLLSCKPSKVKDTRKTSNQKPLDLTKIISVRNKHNVESSIYVSMSPGKKDKLWNRDTKLDINKIKQNNIQVVICLLEDRELIGLNLQHYPQQVLDQGLLFYHLPIPDGSYPKNNQLGLFIPLIINNLIKGKNILIHCRCGYGRCGTLAGCCLVQLGYTPKDSIEIVRYLRPGAIQNTSQEGAVINYFNLINIL